MDIVILDGFTANPGDLEWKRLEALGNLTVYDRTPASLIVERCKGATAIFTNKTPLDAETLRKLPDVRFIGVLATGYNVVDVKEAKNLGITVCNVPAYSTMSVAQNVFALILEFSNHVAHYSREVKEGKWSRCEDFCFTDTPLIELAGKRLGIVGLGTIGKRVALIAEAFGMQVSAYTSKEQKDIEPIQKMTLNELLQSSDIVTLHCPLTEDTLHLINVETLSLMKPSAILINTGRGPLIDEKAVANALAEGKLAGVGVDVLSQEPPREDNPLLSAPNCVITPHISWATKEARERLLNVSVENLEAFLAGKPQNVVS